MLPLYSGCPRGSKPYRKCSTVCHPCKWPEWFWGASSFLYASPPSVARTGLERGPGGAVRRRLALFPISSSVECGLKGCNVGAGLAPALVPAPAPVPARPLPLAGPAAPLLVARSCPCPGCWWPGPDLALDLAPALPLSRPCCAAKNHHEC